MCRSLVGSSVNAVDEDGDSCLHLALMRRSTQEELEESQAIATVSLHRIRMRLYILKLFSVKRLNMVEYCP